MEISYYKNIYNLLCKRHPNQKIYVISDHHFFHANIISYQRPEFQNVIEMNEHIIKEHNSIINQEDIVIFLGDFSFKKTEIKNLLEKMNGHKYLLLGNHDSEDLQSSYGKFGFEGVFTHPVKINKQFLSHYPLEENELDNLYYNLLVKEFKSTSGINYHGHHHTKQIGEYPFVNVCCEAQNYRPLLIGYTESIKEDSCIINSKDFEDILKYIREKNRVDSNLIISDYIYSTILEAVTPYIRSSFVYGSFPLYKKYGYISNFSDLDMATIYNEKLSKKKNQLQLKEMFDTAFEKMKQMDYLDLSMKKRISNMCIFEFLYTNKNGNKYRGYYDTNLVPINIYKQSDFIVSEGGSLLEKLLQNENFDHFTFPKYKVKFLNMDGDIATITLQLLFQQGFLEKKKLALKKLKNIYRIKSEKKISDFNDLENTMVRFFIRNLLFFQMTRRHNEIEYINGAKTDINTCMSDIPSSLKVELEEIFNNPKSLFSYVYEELRNTKFEELPEKGKQLIKVLKK